MSIKRPKISVIMSTYNDAKYLFEAVSSILNQSFTDFEFIIVNDASTDDTANILANFASKDSRLRILTNTENQERCISRNMAIKAAQADYIAVMDADDWAYPERLAKQYAFMEQNPQISICGAQIRIHELDFLSLKIMPWRIYPCSNEEIRKRMYIGCCFYHPTIIMRKEHVLKYTHGYDELTYIVSEDYDLWARLMVHNDIVFANMPETLVKYRVHPFKNRSKTKKNQDTNAKKIKLSLRQALGLPAHLLGCTVITIVYNGAKYLDKCIDSILNQSFMDFEYIIVDDASTDETKSILAELAEKDKRVRILTNTEHKGYFFSLNMAMLTAKSPYLAIMNADTKAHPERLALQYDSMQANKHIGICGAQMEEYEPEKYANEHKGKDTAQGGKIAFTSRPATNYSQFFKHDIWQPTFMLRRDYVLPYLKDCANSHTSSSNSSLWANILKDNELIFANRPEILVYYIMKKDSAVYYEMQPDTKILIQQHLQQHLSKIYHLKMLLSPTTIYIANILEKILPKCMLSPLRLLYNEAKKFLF